MTTVVADPGRGWSELLHMWNESDVIEGWKPEIISGEYLLSPPPEIAHNLIAEEIHLALAAALGRTFAVFQTLGIAIPEIRGIFIPDLCVMNREQIKSASGSVAAAEDVLLAVEIRSTSNAKHDRKTKRWAYAHGPIAQYLLVDALDPEEPMVSLFSDPVDGEYQNIMRTPFGGKVTLATPLDVVIDSALFPTIH